MNYAMQLLLLREAIGLYLIIGAVIMIARASYYRELLRQIRADSPVVVLTASIGLMAGIALVLVHNIWGLRVEVLVTLIAWALLIKSILWLSFPEYMLRCSQKFYAGCWYYAAAVVTGVVGIVLLMHSFSLFQYLI